MTVNRSSHRAPLAALALVSLMLTGCLTSGAATRSPSGLDRKLDNTSFIEEGDLIALVAGTRVAFAREHPDYFPLEVAVVNKGLEGLTVTPESFTLVDESGTSYPVVSGEEVRDATNVDVDRRLSTLAPVIRGRYDGYTEVPGTLTTSFDRPIRRDLQLPRFSWAAELLYFPRPADGVRGRTFELFLRARDLDDPVFVRFKVPGQEKGSP